MRKSNQNASDCPTNACHVLCCVLLVAQLTWKSESLNHLEEERANWEILKQEAIKTILEEEHQRWRETG